MTFDLVYCRGEGCSRRRACQLWIENLKKEIVRQQIDLEGKRIGLTNYVLPSGYCLEFYPIRHTPEKTGKKGDQ